MKTLPIALGLILAGPPLRAQELLPSPETTPEAPSAADFEALKRTSPFTRVLSLTETYALRGVATIGETRVATLYNRETKKTLVVTPEGNNEAGIALVDVVEAPRLDGVTAKIAFAGDEAELRYEVSQLYPEPKPIPGRPGSPPRPGEGGEQRGPSPQDIERYKALPEEKQAKLREYIGHVMRSYPNMSREERGNLIRGAMVRLVDGRDLEVPQTTQAPQAGQDQAGRPGQPGQPGQISVSRMSDRSVQIQVQSNSGGSVQIRPADGGGDRSRSGGDRGGSDGGRSSGGDRR